MAKFFPAGNGRGRVLLKLTTEHPIDEFATRVGQKYLARSTIVEFVTTSHPALSADLARAIEMLHEQASVVVEDGQITGLAGFFPKLP